MNIIQTKQPDYILTATIFLLLTIGIIMVFSSSYVMAYKWYDDSFYFFTKQAFSAIVAVIVLFITMKIDYRHWRKFAIPILILSIFLLVMIYFPGIARNVRGARRWINIGPIPFQPSELAKVALILEKKNMDPTIAIGGEVNDIGGNAKLGKGDYVIVEADESDGSFLIPR